MADPTNLPPYDVMLDRLVLYPFGNRSVVY